MLRNLFPDILTSMLQKKIKSSQPPQPHVSRLIPVTPLQRTYIFCMQFLYLDTWSLPFSLRNAIQLQELLVKYKVMARIISVYHPPAGILLAYNVYTRTWVKYKTATRITSSIHSIENFWYVKTFLVSKYNSNVIFVAQILGIYKQGGPRKLQTTQGR